MSSRSTLSSSLQPPKLPHSSIFLHQEQKEFIDFFQFKFSCCDFAIALNFISYFVNLLFLYLHYYYNTIQDKSQQIYRKYFLKNFSFSIDKCQILWYNRDKQLKKKREDISILSVFYLLNNEFYYCVVIRSIFYFNVCCFDRHFKYN